MTKRYAFFFVLLLAIVKAEAQQVLYDKTRSQNLIDTIDQYFQINPILNSKLGNDSIALSNVFTNIKANLPNFEKEILLEQARIAKNDIGLNLKANTVNNFRSDFDDDAGVYSTFRIRGGLEWKLLKDGFFKRGEKQRYLEKQLEISDFQFQASNQQNIYSYWYNLILYYHNLKKLPLLTLRSELLSFQNQLQKKLINNHEIARDVLIETEQRQLEVQVDIASIKQFNKTIQSVVSTELLENIALLDSLVVGRVNVEAMFLDQSVSNFFDQQLNLQQQLIDLEPYTVADPDFRIQAYWNLNVKDFNGGYYQFPSVNMSYTQPLFKGKKLNTEIKTVKKEELSAQMETVQYNNWKEILNDNYELNYKLKQYLNLAEKFRKEKERVRVDQIIFPEAPSSELLNNYDRLIAIYFQMMDLIQQMQLKALNIHTRYKGEKGICKLGKVQIPNRPSVEVYVRNKDLLFRDLKFTAKYLARYGVTKLCVTCYLNTDELETLKSLINAFEIVYLYENGDNPSEVIPNSNALIINPLSTVNWKHKLFNANRAIRIYYLKEMLISEGSSLLNTN